MLRGAVSRHTLKAVGQTALGNGSNTNETMHPNLGLHSAAASGNIGLVKFALENGQPANSNLNGILPLHAACSGGSEPAVRMLLMYGADVNAPRLKSKGSGGGPGAEGSTPLHFAAANGHLEITRILLEAGARPSAADKDGVVAEALALGNGHNECANLIRSWIAAYGSNGLAGMVSSREAAASRDLALGPGSLIRYAAGSQSGSTTATGPPTPTEEHALVHLPSMFRRELGAGAALLRSQRSFDQIGATATTSAMRAVVSSPLKKQSLSKTSSNPNLRSQALSSTPTMPPLLPWSTSTHGSLSQPSQAISPCRGFPTLSLAERSPSPLNPSQEEELAFSFHPNPPPAGMVATLHPLSQTNGPKESKRRPSLPSIFERAAHPAASIRAALGVVTLAHGHSHAASSSGEHLGEFPSVSPLKKTHKLSGKRSFSNMLRKATGGGGSNTHSNSIPYIETSSLANLSNLSLSKPYRTAGKSFDYYSVRSDQSRHHPRSDSSEDWESWRPVTAPFHQTSFPPSSFAPKTSDTAASIGGQQQQRLRGSSSSSALSNQIGSLPRGARARSSSNDQVTLHTRAPAPFSRSPYSGKMSLDTLRSESSFFGLANQSLSTSTTSLDNRSGMSVPRLSSSSFNTQPGSAMRMRKMSNRSAPSGLPPRQDTDQAALSHDQENTSDVASSDGNLSTDVRARSKSACSRPSLSADSLLDGSKSSRAKHQRTPADSDDVQEFLGDAEPVPLDDIAGELHDVHHLPAGLRNLSAMRSPRGDTSGSRTGGFGSATSNPPSPSVLPIRRSRDRSMSSLSAISMGSQSSKANPAASSAEAMVYRDSPGNGHAMSIADEMEMASHHHNKNKNNGSSYSILTRARRSGSQAESVGSKPSTSSLRSIFLSAAEQAQAILNRSSAEGPDGAPMSLAAQLAAYGDALAKERKRAGDARAAPSPSLSGRTSSTAPKTTLPSVCEDHSVPQSGSPHSRKPNADRQTPNSPNFSTLTRQTFPRRQSQRRPHSSEGTEPQSPNARHASSVSASRSKTINPMDPPSGLRNLFLDTPHNPSLDGGRRNVLGQGLGSPLITNSLNTMGSMSPLNKAKQSYEPIHDAWQPSSNPEFDRRVSEDLLRQHRPLTKASHKEGEPKTPALFADVFEVDGSSPRGQHRHSPSMPTELSSYSSSRKERFPINLSSSTHTWSNLATTGMVSNGPAPLVPPRKESISVSNGLLTPEHAISPRPPCNEPYPTSPLGTVGSPNRYDAIVVGLGLQHEETSKHRPSWDTPRRPSFNLLRKETNFSSTSQSTSMSHDDQGDEPNKATTGRRRLMRNFLNGIKGGSTAAG